MCTLLCARTHYNISRGRSHKSARRIIISHYGTYTRVHLLNSTYAIGYNVPFLSTIKSNANHLAGRTVHLVRRLYPRAHTAAFATEIVPFVSPLPTKTIPIIFPPWIISTNLSYDHAPIGKVIIPWRLPRVSIR